MKKVSKRIKTSANGEAICKIEVHQIGNSNKPITISTGLTFPASAWNEKLKNVSKIQNCALINNAIDRVFFNVERIVLENPNRTLDDLREILSFEYPSIKQKNKKTEARHFNEYCRLKLHKSIELKISTYKNHQKILRHLDNISPATPFGNVNADLVNKIKEYCLANRYSDNTTYNIHKTIKKYINDARMDGLIPSEEHKHPYAKQKVKRVKNTNRDYLTAKEIKIIESANLPEHLNPFRDYFLFMCCTGLRISDFMRINKEMLKDGHLILTPEKTDKFGTDVDLPISVLYNGKPLKIWQKYDLDFKVSKAIDQKLNTQLKVIAKHCGIKKLLTCHVARHTFLTDMARKTKDIFTVMKLGGIRKIDTAMIYIHIAETESADLLKNVSW